MDQTVALSCKALLIAAMLSVLSCVAAASDVLPEAGSYLILKNATGRPLAGAYRLGEGTKRTFREGTSDRVLVDREFLPRRVTLSFTMNVSRLEYEPDVDPETLVDGKSRELLRSRFTSFPDLSSRGSPFMEKFKSRDSVQLAATSSRRVTVGGVMMRRIDYEITVPLRLSGLGTATSRVYLPEFDIDLDAAVAEDIASMERGTASSSEDFAALYLSRGADTAEAAACIEEKRAGRPFREASARYRIVADAYTAKSFPERGLDSDLALGISAEMLDLYKALDVKDCFK